MKKIRILGRDYKVRRMRKKDAENLSGRIMNWRQIMEVDTNPQVPDQCIEDTVLHEAIHAMDYHYNLKLSEQKVKLLESGLVTFLRDNGVSLKALNVRNKS